MILICEPHWTATTHAPINGAILRIITQAFPNERVRVLADPSHLTELRRDRTGHDASNITFQPIAISPLFRGSPQIVSFARLRTEWTMLRRALADVPANEPCLLVLLSTTATLVFLASWLTRWRGQKTATLVVLHGNLNEVCGWRPRNPFKRGLDMRAGLLARHPFRFRFLLLESGIQEALARLLPAAAQRAVVLPHPINVSETEVYPPLPLRAPIRIGLVGQATKAKGIDVFLALAQRVHARHGARVEFHLIGHVAAGQPRADFAALTPPIGNTALSRADFTDRLAKMHYVMFALGTDYYNLAASGAIVDAITALKPFLALPIPIVNALFAEFGDIGHLVADVASMEVEIDKIMSEPTSTRYPAQIAALRRLRDSRTPEALISRVQRIVRDILPNDFV